jgi:hypothetical protein
MSLQDKLKERITDNYKSRKDYSAVKRPYALDVPENTNFFKAYYDKINKICILPYIVETDNDPKVKKGEETYILEYYVHRGVGADNGNYLCLQRTYGKACPICEEIDKLKDEYEKNKEFIRTLNASKRAAYNVIDVLDTENPGEVKIFDASFAFFEKEMLEEVIDPETKEIVCFPDTSANGYYVRFRATEEALGKIKYPKYKSFRFERRKEAISEDILKKVISLDSLLIIPTYEQVKNAFYGVDEEESTDEKYYKEVIEKEEATEKVIKKEEKTECPSGHVFGKDVDAYDECIQCKAWEKCSEKQEKD